MENRKRKSFQLKMCQTCGFSTSFLERESSAPPIVTWPLSNKASVKHGVGPLPGRRTHISCISMKCCDARSGGMRCPGQVLKFECQMRQKAAKCDACSTIVLHAHATSCQKCHSFFPSSVVYRIGDPSLHCWKRIFPQSKPMGESERVVNAFFRQTFSRAFP